MCFLISSVALSCNQTARSTQQEIEIPTPVLSDSESTLDSFNISLQVLRVEPTKCMIAITLDFHYGSYIYSPYSTDSFYLNFNLSLEENSSTTFIGKLEENPESIVELDSLIKKSIRTNREKTIFTHAVEVLSTEDFQAAGQIEFLLEPSCRPYIIEFDLTQSLGELKITKTSTRFNYSYN